MIKKFDSDVKKTVVRNNLDGKYAFIWFDENAIYITSEGLTDTDAIKAGEEMAHHVRRILSHTDLQPTERG